MLIVELVEVISFITFAECFLYRYYQTRSNTGIEQGSFIPNQMLFLRRQV